MTDTKIQREKFTTALDPDLIQRLKEKSFQEFGTDRKANLLIERALRKLLDEKRSETHRP